MPAFFRASVFQPLARTRNATIVRIDIPQDGDTPNQNTVLIDGSALRTDAVVRNILNLSNPNATDVLWYGYEDDANLLATGFPLEPGASISIQAGLTVYAKSGTGTTIPVAIDGGLE